MNKNTLIALCIAVILILGGLIYLQQNDRNTDITQTETPTSQNNNQTNEQNSNTDPSTTLNPGTRTYNSEKLGVTFTYNPMPAETFEVTVTERDNKIYLHGTKETPEQEKIIEVFTKTSSQTLSQAIKERFLKGYSETNCFVVDIPKDPSDERPNTYSFAEISYPEPTEPSQPFWQNASKCPQPYSKTNAVQYFMANSEVPTRYVFLQLGQDSITDDGRRARSDGSKSDWSASIRIIK